MKTFSAALAVAFALTAVACAAPSESEGDADTETGTTTEAVTVCQPSISGAAITKQIVSVGEPVTLTVELVTLSPKPYSYHAATVSFPAGFAQQSLASTCTDTGSGSWRCRHLVVLGVTTATSGTGNYAMTLMAEPDAGSGCWIPSFQTIPFSLQTESFGYLEVNGQ